MTLQTNLLDMRLLQAVARARQLLAAQIAPGGGLLDDGRVWFDKPEVVAFWHGLEALQAELRRMLRQFGALQRQRDAIEAAIAAAPREQRWQEQARITSFDDDLARVFRRAALLASLLATLRRRGGEISGIEWAQGVHHIGTEVGKLLDQTVVRRTVQRVTTQPAYVSAGAWPFEPGATLEVLFVVFALVTALLQRSGRGR